MPIREIRPKAPLTNVTPQCCAKVEAPTYNKMWRHDRYARRKAKDGVEWQHDQCQRPSTVIIDRKPYCRLHAGQRALEKWLARELVEPKK